MFIPTSEQSKDIKKQFGTPIFVTDASYIRKNAEALLGAFAHLNLKIFYAIKANFNPSIVTRIKEAGIYGIDAVSVHEVRHALSLGYTPEQIIFTPSNPSTEEIQEIGNLGIMQNLGSLSELDRYGQLFPGTDVAIRISPEVGAGESKKVSTGGKDTKFGLSLDDLSSVETLCRKHDVSIVGIHSHIGSGFYEESTFRQSVEAVLKVAKQFHSVEFVDFGGGFGVQYHPEKEGIDLQKFAQSIEDPVALFTSETGRTLELRIEPGKYLVSNSTVLLAEVTTIKEKGDVVFVGLNTGFNHLIRPAMYNSYQHIVNASRTEGIMQEVTVTGNVCETCDVFNEKVEIVRPQEGDLLAILVAGGYGSSMSSNYNMQGMAAEVLIDNDETRLIRKRQDLDDVTRMFL